MRWSWVVVCALAIAAGRAGADASVTQAGAAAESGWCVALYLKEAKRAAPKAAAAAAGAKPAAVDASGASVRLELPATFTATVVERDVVQVAAGAPIAGDAFGGWDATLHVRPQTRAELEARVRAIPSDFTGETHARITARAGTWRGAPADELCAVVERTAGHATMTNGQHHAMPPILELVHGFVRRIDGQSWSAAYRLPPQAIDQVALWEAVLASVEVSPPAAMIVVFNKNVPDARAAELLTALGWPFHSGSDSSRGKVYFYAHGPQFTVRVPPADIGRFTAQTKTRREIFETYRANYDVQKD
jgi:hypothetical protein